VFWAPTIVSLNFSLKSDVLERLVDVVHGEDGRLVPRLTERRAVAGEAGQHAVTEIEAEVGSQRARFSSGGSRGRSGWRSRGRSGWRGAGAAVGLAGAAGAHALSNNAIAERTPISRRTRIAHLPEELELRDPY
jgi:hypothetical protein